jgi:hypothetical protein
LKALNEQNKEAKTSLPFTVARVEDPELISDLEKVGCHRALVGRPGSAFLFALELSV